MTDLKPCPFCGGTASFERFGNARQSCIVSCDYCGCRLEANENWDFGTAWNTRTVDPDHPAPRDGVTVERLTLTEPDQAKAAPFVRVGARERDKLTARLDWLLAEGANRNLNTRALALVAEAYEAAAETCHDIHDDGLYGDTLTSEEAAVALECEEDIRALTPADAIAAREARDAEVWNAALMEAAGIAKQYDKASDCMDCIDTANIYHAILDLIEKDKTNE